MATQSSTRILSPFAVCATAISVSAVLGALTFWRVGEGDLFWLMHLGRDILASGHVAGVDSWSSTARGQPWPDYEWLSAVIFELVGRVKPLFHLLPGFRALVAAIPFLLLASRMRSRRFSDLATFGLLAPLVYVICWERFYLRAELLAFAFAFAPLVALWRSLGRDGRIGAKIAASAALLILWANLHAGTAVVGILATVAWIAALPPRALPWPRRATAMGAMALTWFCTPIGFAVIPVVWRNAIGADWSVQLNYDHMPVLPQLFDLSVEGWTYPFWLTMTVAGVAALWTRARRSGQERRIELGLILILVALTMGKARARIYPTYILAFELFPLIADALANAGRHRVRRWSAVGAGVVVAWAGVAYQAAKIMPAFGTGLLTSRLPVETVRFLREDRPSGKVMNQWDFGGYLGYMAGDLYAVSSDGRALPFLGLERELQESQRRGPEDFAARVAQHGFDIVLEKVPQMAFFDGVGYRDTHHAWFPARTWALVAFDNASVVYLRRTPEHADEIAKREYRMLLRDRPPNFGTDSPDATPEERESFESELDTCLKRCPTCSYCLTGKACFLKKRGSIAESESLIAAAEKSPSPEFDSGAIFAVCARARP